VTTRATRINTIPAGAQLGGHVGDLKDVSVTGALVVLDVELPVDSVHALALGAGPPVLELRAQVVRARQTTEQPPRWQIGVRFVDITPQARRAIPGGVARLLAALDPDATPAGSASK
jgi:hypothetical protein